MNIGATGNNQFIQQQPINKTKQNNNRVIRNTALTAGAGAATGLAVRSQVLNPKFINTVKKEFAEGINTEAKNIVKQNAPSLDKTLKTATDNLKKLFQKEPVTSTLNKIRESNKVSIAKVLSKTENAKQYSNKVLDFCQQSIQKTPPIKSAAKGAAVFLVAGAILSTGAKFTNAVVSKVTGAENKA